jgi:hypothetical protein
MLADNLPFSRLSFLSLVPSVALTGQGLLPRNIFFQPSKLNTRLVPSMKGYDFKQEDSRKVENSGTSGEHRITVGGIS